MMQCSNCGIPFDHTMQRECPKCGEMGYYNDIYCIDIAHAGEDWVEAEQKIVDGIDYCLKNYFKGLKVIHGRGNERGHTAIIKSKAVEYLKSYARRHNARLTGDRGNNGAHILYFG